MTKEASVVHSFTDKSGMRWTACSECNRGGNGNDTDKCAAGWRCTEWNGLGCYSGSVIIGEPKKLKKFTRSQARYRRYLEYGDVFDSFINYCKWDSEPERSWNNL